MNPVRGLDLVRLIRVWYLELPVCLVFVLSACTVGLSTRAVPQSIEVEMVDFGYSIIPSITPGRAVLHVDNRGSFAHELILVPLSASSPRLEQLLRDDKKEPVPTIAVTPIVPPGGDIVFALDLAPGRYGIFCGLKGGTGDETHALRGMVEEFKVK